MTISESSRVYKNVHLGKNVIIEDFCEIGVPMRGQEDGDIPTYIGDNAHIRSHTTIYAGNRIGDSFQTGHKVNIRENNEIGNSVSVGTLSVIEHQVKIEDEVRLHTQVFVPEHSLLKKKSWLGPNVVLTNAKYPMSPTVKDELEGPVIGENAIIGANATILPGIKIGRDAVVGAGTVVTKDIGDQEVAVGNPQRTLKNKSELPYE